MDPVDHRAVQHARAAEQAVREVADPACGGEGSAGLLDDAGR
jgi:hypothetical protein